MGCCLCKKYKWPDPQEVIWRDEQDEGKGYCVFHAPVEHKGISNAEYEELVHARIDAFVAAGGEHPLCYFSGAVFHDGISFNRYDQDDPLPSISFAGATFGAGAEFDRATFGEWAGFSGATFGERASFAVATFGERASFFAATFGERASFFAATFGEGASFYEATFGEEASFDQATFGKGASFDGATFGDWAGFSGATFGEGARFERATFGEGARFQEATFGKNFSFQETTFSGSSFFTSANLQEGTTFPKTKFKGGAYFFKATIGDRTLFSEADFNARSSFYGASFGKQVIFSKCSFNKPAVFGYPLNIEDLRFQDMTSAQIQNASFLHCPLKNIAFTNVDWPRDDENSRYSVPSESMALKDIGDDDKINDAKRKKLAAIADFYRQMKKRCRDEQNDSEASLWHTAEKEVILDQLMIDPMASPRLCIAAMAQRFRILREENTDANVARKYWRIVQTITDDTEIRSRTSFVFHRLSLQVYRKISRYGEDHKQALLVLLMLAAILGVFVLLGAAFAPEPSNNAKTLDFFGVIHVFFQYLLFDRPSYDLNKFFAAMALFVSRLLIPIQAAIFVFALRNKLHR